jgi:hypothetical protein
MKTKAQIIQEFKSAHPTLKSGNDNDGYIELSEIEYEAEINRWADNEIMELQAKAAETLKAELKAQAKATAQAKLAALGLTVEDLQALGL